MGLYATTDTGGEVSFLLPADGGNSTNYNGYKFRADYSGTQTWSDPLLVTADVNNPFEIAVGGSSGLSPRLRVPVSPRHGNEVQIASLDILPGMLAQLVNTTLPDSNGEYLYFYHNDHLGTPLFLTDTAGVVVWKGEYLPFGGVFTEDRDPDGDGVDIEQPFRFPGQYEDAETGLYYNYFRDYDPQIGRYVEADPSHYFGSIHLEIPYAISSIIDEPEELNDWNYVRCNPVLHIDNSGLYTIDSSCNDFKVGIEWGMLAVSNAINSSCIRSEALRGKLRDKMTKLKIKCKNMNLCGKASPILSNNIYLSPESFKARGCGKVEYTILHEMIHSTGKISEVVPRSCEASCFNYNLVGYNPCDCR